MNFKFIFVELCFPSLIMALQVSASRMSTTTKRVAPILGLLAVVSLALMPLAAASPLTATLTWTPNPNPTPGSAEIGTVNVQQDSDCPSGQTYSGTLTVTPPGGSPVSTATIPATPCGTAVTGLTYGGTDTDFSPEGSTLVCGTYVGEWAGATTAVVAGSHPSFDLKVNFSVTGCKVTTAPEFGASAVLVAAMALVAMAVMTRSKLLKAW